MRRCQTRVLKHLSSQACVGIILRSPPISCRQGRYTRETECGLDSRTSIMYRCEHKTCANTLILENQDINSRSNTSLSSTVLLFLSGSRTLDLKSLKVPVFFILFHILKVSNAMLLLIGE